MSGRPSAHAESGEPRGVKERLLERLESLRAGARLELAGLPGAARAYAIAVALEAGLGPALVVAADEKAADRLAQDLEVLLGAFRGAGETPRVVRLPADEIIPYDELAPDPGVVAARLAALDRLARGPAPEAVVVGARGLSQRLLPREVVVANAETLERGGTCDRDALARRLALAGYQNVPLVEDPGTFSVRGGIVDVFSPLSDLPTRIDLFGDEIESLRAFDPETQRTTTEIERLEIGPAREILFTDETVRRATLAVRELAAELRRPTREARSVLDDIEGRRPVLGLETLLPTFYERGLVPLSEHADGFRLSFVDDPAAVGEALDALWQQLREEHEVALTRRDLVLPPERHHLEPEAALAQLDGTIRLEHHALLVEEPGAEPLRLSVEPTGKLRRAILEHHGEDGALTPLVRALHDHRDRGIATILACSSAGQAERLRRLLVDRDLRVRPEARFPDLSSPEALYDPSVDAIVAVGDLGTGFVDPAGALAIVSEADVFGPGPPPSSRRRAAAETGGLGSSFRELREGDLVVHVEHGIGRYGGLTRLELRGVEGDFLLIEYAGKDKIYLPVHRLGKVSKYVGGDAEHVRLDRLGSSSFAVRKKKVHEELLKMAAELLDIYAARKAHPGTAFSPSSAYFREFEAEFPYQETGDQARAIEEVLADMERPEPMDRLVCGDVGFGKTEVALRAAMKAVLDGKQVAVLVPTTVLAVQHERTFRERFQGYPVIVESLSRFGSAKQTREVLARCAKGKVDVLIGTHRLLSRDVSFKDLGLVVVDEEQRFGVKQKEALKRLRRQVDVLTLTATPIPRTLHMSLAGIRDLSIIATAPADRRAIRTFVSRFDAAVIKEAVERELARGGQVFVVHHRVESIRGVERYLRSLLPDVRLVVAHGQMQGRELERAMTAFVRREADVLLSTTIIESGLDIPTVNTMVVDRADTFGLAQLYQLRGRVGRSRERAYCYLLVPARRSITKEAKQRLAVLQELTELGSGFRLASRDLEIRGAGNLLGKAQSGHVAALGFDLYSQLLDEAVRELRGEPPKASIEPEVVLPVPAFIPDEYVPDVQQRLDLYKRFSQAEGRADLDALLVELVDRYGEVPREVDNLVAVMAVKARLSALSVRALDTGPGRIVITLGPEARLDGPALAARVARATESERGWLTLTSELKLVAKVPPPSEEAGWIAAAKRVLEVLEGCARDGA